jgi:hypothetical protein
MSHFEYVSVAIALMYAIAVGRLLGGLSISMTESRRYWIHTTWIVVLLLVSVAAWWAMWRGNEVTWTPIRFLWALSMPAIIYLRAAVLLGRPEEAPDSFYDHFYEVRPLFFSLGLAVAIFIALTPWVFGLVPWLKLAPLHFNAVMLFSISALGLYFRKPTVHGVLVILSLAGVVAGFLIIPVATSAT